MCQPELLQHAPSYSTFQLFNICILVTFHPQIIAISALHITMASLNLLRLPNEIQQQIYAASLEGFDLHVVRKTSLEAGYDCQEYAITPSTGIRIDGVTLVCKNIRALIDNLLDKSFTGTLAISAGTICNAGGLRKICVRFKKCPRVKRLYTRVTCIILAHQDRYSDLYPVFASGPAVMAREFPNLRSLHTLHDLVFSPRTYRFSQFYENRVLRNVDDDGASVRQVFGGITESCERARRVHDSENLGIELYFSTILFYSGRDLDFDHVRYASSVIRKKAHKHNLVLQMRDDSARTGKH